MEGLALLFVDVGQASRAGMWESNSLELISFVLLQIMQIMWNSKGCVLCMKSVTSQSDHFLINFYKITDTYRYKYKRVLIKVN